MALLIPDNNPELAEVEFKAPDMADIMRSIPPIIRLHESTKALSLKNPTIATIPKTKQRMITDMSRITATMFEKSI